MRNSFRESFLTNKRDNRRCCCTSFDLIGDAVDVGIVDNIANAVDVGVVGVVDVIADVDDTVDAIAVLV